MDVATYGRKINVHKSTDIHVYDATVTFADDVVNMTFIDTVTMDKYHRIFDQDTVNILTGKKINLTTKQFYNLVKTSFIDIDSVSNPTTFFIKEDPRMAYNLSIEINIPLKITIANCINVEHIISFSCYMEDQTDVVRIEAMLRKFNKTLQDANLAHILNRIDKLETSAAQNVSCNCAEIRNCVQELEKYIDIGHRVLDCEKRLISLENLIKRSETIEGIDYAVKLRRALESFCLDDESNESNESESNESNESNK